ncbi:MAG: efflux RND transporter periplasmic adaptor subunit [Chitinophagaceae bacterium]|nr:efflux RND transporter periplasmic adaptor subunit [Chitinophagaceae bacterium]
MNLKYFPTLFSISFLIAACGSNDKKTTPSPQANTAQPALSLEGYIIQSRSINDNIEVPGTILPFESTEIHPEISGRIVLLNVKEGSFVNKGSLLAKIYDGDLQAQLKKFEVQLGIAEQSEKRSAQLLKIQGISQQDYDLSLLNVNNIKADIEITKASISKTTILAPFSGKLGLKNISPGAFVTPATIITTIGQVNQLKLQFTVPEKYGTQIKNGQDIQFTIDGSEGVFHAIVSATEVAIEENSRSLSVRAIVKDRNPVLIPGAFAKVKMILGKNENAIMIPNSSVLPQGRKKIAYVYRSGKAVVADITTGVRDSANIQVLSGLNTGDTLLTTGILYLRAGSDVKLSKIK